MTPGAVGRSPRRLTKATAVFIMPVLFAAWAILYLFPTRTDELWAWTIAGRMTAITMGSGYLGGVWYFARVARDPTPHRVAGGLFAAWIFVTLLGAATVIHWDKFDHGHPAFWAWSALYFFTPFFLPVLFVANRRASAPTAEAELSRHFLVLLLLVGVTQLVGAVTWYVAPDLGIANWPWPMTPLTMRTIASFVAFSGALLTWAALDRRWTSVRYGVEALTLGLAVTGIGAAVAHADFTGRAVGVALYGGALVYLLCLFGLVMARLRRDRPEAPIGAASRGRAAWTRRAAPAARRRAST